MKLAEYLQQPPNLPLARKLTYGNVVVSVLVLALVAIMRKVKVPVPDGVDFSFLPPLYSTINAIAACCLIVAYIQIRKRNVLNHKRAINAAMVCSLLFLLLYVVYHLTTPATKYGGEGPVRLVYFVLLISHIVLAATSLPFILQTWILGVTNQFEKHRRLAKWIFPIWLYVAVSGPVCYLMLRPYYGD